MPTVQKILYDARALVDEYNEGGVITSSDNTDIKTIETNGIRFVDMAYQEIYNTLKYYEEYLITLKKPPNLLGGQYNIKEFIGDDQHYPKTKEGIVGAKSYFFTLDDDATVLIREFNGATWNTLITLNLTPTEPTDYKGLITPTNSDYPIEMVFSGSTYYKHYNRCLYSYPFKTDSIPDYKPYIRFDMPDDYGELEEIIEEFSYARYYKDAIFKWENFKTLTVNNEFEGTLRIIYKPTPTQLTQLTDELNINNPIATQFITFFTAAKIATTENTDLVNFFEGKANELKFEALKEQPASEEKIQDVYRVYQNGNGRGYNGRGYNGRI